MNGHTGMCRARCQCPDQVHHVEAQHHAAAIIAERRACAELCKQALGKFKPGSREWAMAQLLARAIIERVSPTHGI